MAAERRVTAFGALPTALSWLTVVPVPAPPVTPTRADGAAVIRLVPVVGALLGLLAVGIAFLLAHTAASAALIGLLLVAVLALATRGMHLDGLADTVDGLGCYGPPERVREVMRSGGAGPFAIAALALTIGIQAVCFGTLVDDRRWYAVGFAIALSRFAVIIACRSGLPPANPDGFGALVGGSQRWAIPIWAAIATAAAIPVGAGGVAAVAVTAALAWAGSAHCARRMGGINGDVLGAAIEMSCTATLVTLVLTSAHWGWLGAS